MRPPHSCRCPGWALGLLAAWGWAAGPEPDTGTRGVPRAPQGRRGQDGRRVAVPFPVSGGRRHHLTSRKGQQSAGGGCRAAGWPGRRPPEPVVPVPSPRSPRGRCPARAQPRGGATGPTLGWHRGCGQGAGACGGRAPPLWGWGRRGGRVRWALRGRQRLPLHVPARPFSCVWPPRCCHAVALERSSGLAQKPLWDAEKWRPKVTLLQAAGEGRGRREGSVAVPSARTQRRGLRPRCQDGRASDPQAEELGL